MLLFRKVTVDIQDHPDEEVVRWVDQQEICTVEHVYGQGSHTFRPYWGTETYAAVLAFQEFITALKEKFK